VVLCGLALAAGGCLPDRRPPAVLDASEPEDTITGDTAATDGQAGDLAAADSADVTADVGADVTKKDVPALGCTTDKQCEIGLAACFVGACDKASGLCQAVALPEDATCGSATLDKCTKTRTCQAGTCTALAVVCDDLQGCTDDTCDPAAGCTHTPNTAWCDDGSVCTLGDGCKGGSCQGKAIVCDDTFALPDGKPAANVCTTDACNAKTGCQHAPIQEDTVCDDGNVCTEADGCKQGKCQGTPVVCKDDGNECTLEGCTHVNKQGCTTAPVDGLSCQDDNACTQNDLCANSKCAGTPACDDANPCTDDACVPSEGCSHKANTATCTGKDPCTEASGTCAASACVLKAKVCDDGNLCTDDACDAKTGCTLTAKAFAPCSDGNPCTVDDVCDAGACKAGGPNACDDGDACTADSCQTGVGCAHLAVAPGTVCGSNKQCVVGLCLDNKACGDKLCALGETFTACAGDCPETNGACAADDSTCTAACTLQKCPKFADGCAKVPACGGLQACLAECADVACDQGCFAKAPPAAVVAFLALHPCVQAFCVQDAWIGKKCQGGGQAYGQCVGDCTAAMCPVQDTACLADTTCAQVIACVDKCGDNDAACVQACGASNKLYDARVLCAQVYCL